MIETKKKENQDNDCECESEIVNCFLLQFRQEEGRGKERYDSFLRRRREGKRKDLERKEELRHITVSPSVVPLRRPPPAPAAAHTYTHTHT